MWRRTSSQRALFIFVVFIAPILYLVSQAVWNPDIEFLVPTLRAKWALYPDEHVLDMRGAPVSDDVLFRRSFHVSIKPTRLVVEYRVFTEAVIELNGRTLATEALDNWKKTARIDLTSHLRLGKNELTLRIHNPGAVPALLVTSPAWLRTPGDWRAALNSEAGTFRPVVPPSAEVPKTYEFRQAKPNALVQRIGRSGLAVLVFFWLGTLIGVGSWTFLRQPMKVTPDLRKPGSGSLPKGVVSTSVLVVSLGFHLWNAVHYPHERSYFDWKNHTEYVQEMAETWRAPTARDGFQMYQPPGYYWCAAVIYRIAGGDDHPEAALKAVQFLGAAAGWGLVLLTWLLARRLFDDEASRVVATAFAAFLPMLLYCSPMISNETFSAFVIALAFYYVAASDDFAAPRRAAVGGVLCGLALLSKYTALFTFAGAGAFLAARSVRKTSRVAWRPLAAFLAPVLVLSGWLYVRNTVEFGDPFVGNWDEQSGFHYEQNPGYRSPKFYLGFGRLFSEPTEHAPWLSWADGMYATMWADPFQSFLNPGDDRLPIWVAIALLLAAWPTILILIGFADTIRRALERPFGDVDFLLAAVPVWSLSALISFSLELPFYSTVKTFFLLSLVPIFGILLARGRSIVVAGAKPLRLVSDSVLVSVALINVVLYRYPVQ
jgi:4-amino-4-deoxy-L-arabinose transferase-like glycosyltransferase